MLHKTSQQTPVNIDSQKVFWW